MVIIIIIISILSFLSIGYYYYLKFCYFIIFYCFPCFCSTGVIAEGRQLNQMWYIFRNVVFEDFLRGGVWEEMSCIRRGHLF